MIYLISTISILFLISLYYCIKFALIIIKIQDVIEDSLDKIDLKYNRISQISEIPVFFDSPEIKNLLFEIDSVKSIVHAISYNLANINKKEINEEVDEES